MIILIVVTLLVCACSITGFILYKRYQMTELDLTVTEERYLEVFKLRKEIKRTEKMMRVLDKNSAEHKEQQKHIKKLCV